MENGTIILKIKQRLNKLSSNDYDNIEPWAMIEAFNKGQVEWCRRNLHGNNAKQEGDEGSKRRIDDLQVLLTEYPVTLANKQIYFEATLPEDYFEWKRIQANAKDDCCPKPRRMVVYLAEEGNVDELLRDKNKQPSFDWAETFCTLKNGLVRIYTDGKFVVEDTILSYYRQPRKIQILGVIDPYTLQTSTAEVQSEFKDDIVELFVDEAVQIMAYDIENFNQAQRSSQSVEKNN